jgi:hypothetical protein
LGELAPVKAIEDAEAGYHAIDGMGGQELARSFKQLYLNVPACAYCSGDGIYDNKWRHFNFQNDSDFWNTLIAEVQRAPWDANKQLIARYIQESKASMAQVIRSGRFRLRHVNPRQRELNKRSTPQEFTDGRNVVGTVPTNTVLEGELWVRLPDGNFVSLQGGRVVVEPVG